MLFLIVVVLGCIGFAGWQVYRSKRATGTVSNGDASKQISELKRDCKGTGPVTMQHAPMDMKDVGTVLPIGTLAGAHVTPIDHLYFYPKDMQNRDAAPVYAMADGYIVSYQERGVRVDTGQAQRPEYRIEIQHNCDIVSYFDLMTSLDDSIKGQMKQNGKLHVPVKAGQVLGRVGAQSLDTAIYNYSMTLKGFVNPSSYNAEPWKIHTDDFFKYFNDPIKSEMVAKNPRTAEPRGGKIDYDIAGKLIGNWFLVGTNGYAGPKGGTGVADGNGRGYWSGHLSIAPDAIRPNITNVSFGDYEGQAKQFSAKSGSPDPATIDKTTGVVKYELIQYQVPSPTPTGGVQMVNEQVMGTVLVQVLDNNQLKVEPFPGKTAAQVSGFTSSAKTYER